MVFSWQGGEPTLLGLEFFRKVVELEQKYKKPNQRIENDLQTNGTLLNDEWGAFLKQHRFLVGLSIDGPKELHDQYRVTKDGKPTFDKVFAAAQMLHRHGVSFNVLCVINRVNAKRPARRVPLPEERSTSAPDAVHSVCRTEESSRTPLPSIGLRQRYRCRILPPHIRALPDSVVTDWSVDPDDWGYFLCKVWDDWYRRDIGKVFINQFENAVAMWMGEESQMCVYHQFCGKGVALEHDGNLYSCDHYVYSEYKLGNITEVSSSRMVFSEQQRQFGFDKFHSLPQQCRKCEFLFACNGECPKNRVIRTRDGEAGTELPVQRAAEVLAPH